MNADDRRELVLTAATRAFAQGGYAGTSTDAVAKEAGVSQPYVVRIFGTKRQLFLEVLGLTCAQIQHTFATVIAEGFDPDSDDDWGRLGLAYTELLRDRDLLMVLMHGFAAGNDDEIAACARTGMGSIFATVMSTGCSEERAEEFVAQGMLLNVMLSMRAPEHLDEVSELTPLTRCAFGDALPLLTNPSGG
ncbi:MAG TPA: TetR/AcrR family transcriptional regulator [Nocardioides bacterium]|nr:TetR/AcrR family transcriptional regulator [Nocardioides sp.]